MNDIRPALYARVSSDQQVRDQTNASQIAALRLRIQEDGWTLKDDDCFIDEGVSGSVLIRPALERLRDRAAEGTFDRLYVLCPDRLARTYAHQVLLIEELARVGVEVVFLNHTHDHTPEGQLLLQVQGIIAEYERAKIQERNRRGKMHAARTGAISIMGSAPYGYRYIRRNPDGGEARYEVIPEEAEWVRRIFTWVSLEDCSLADVCRRLDGAGVMTRHRRRGWCISTVAQMLANTAYIGTAVYGATRTGPRRRDLRRPRRLKQGRTRSPYSIYRTDPSEQVPIPVPAIIDGDLFEATRQRLAANRRRKRIGVVGATNLLQGLLVCARCGYAYHGYRSHCHKKNPYCYYRCGGSNPSRVGADALCKNRLLNMKKVDEAVWEDVRGILLDPHRLAEEHHRRVSGPSPADTPRAALWGRRIASLRQGIARLIDAYQNGDISKEEFEPRIQSSRERLAQLEGMASAVEDRERCEEQLRLAIGRLEEFSKQIRERLDTCEFLVRRDIILALVDKIEVDELVVRIVYKVAIGPFDAGPIRGILQHRLLSVAAIGFDLCCGGHSVRSPAGIDQGNDGGFSRWISRIPLVDAPPPYDLVESP
jgi:site-specific DNA recombinase